MESPKDNPIAVRCAFIRALLLEKFGGLYIDTDCIALKDLISVIDLLEDYDFVAMRRTSAKTNHISVGFYASRKNGLIISEYAEQLRCILDQKLTFKWGEIGAFLLTPIVDKYLNKAYLFRENRIHPIVAEDQFKFCDTKLEPSDVIPSNAICFMLYHKIFETHVNGVTLKDCSTDDLYNGNMLISKVFRMAYPGKMSDAPSSRQPLLRKEMQSLLHSRTESPALLDRTCYWVPPVPLMEDQKRTLNSSLRIGAIVGNRLYEGLRFEGVLFPLTPDNWEKILHYANLDIIIIESCRYSATGHWYLSQFIQNEQHDKILEIVKTAEKLSIPAIFWHTQDHIYHNHYKSLASHFDFIFCADPREAEALESMHAKVELLPPAVQPAIHNPFRDIEHVDAFRIKVLYDGWTDLIRLEEKLRLLRDIIPFGLNIIESRGRLLDPKLNELPDYKPYILGCVTQAARRTALKYAEAAIAFEETLLSTTKQQWRALETAAFRLPVLYKGRLAESDIRKNIVIEHGSDDEVIEHLSEYERSPLQREKNGHLAWREVFSKHTFSHRLRSICNKIGITHDWVEFPPISIITPTYREELLPRCVENFDKQNYPNKELIIIFNSNKKDVPEIPEVSTGRNNVRVLVQPREIFVGSCLNAGTMMATGDFCMRVDDDDSYGTHCVADIMLHQKAIDMDLFGKPTNFYCFQGKDNVFWRPFRVPSLCIIPSNKLDMWNFHVAGNLLGGKREFFISSSYQDQSFGAADSSYLYNNYGEEVVYACLDIFNVTIYRNSDEKKHTWKISQEELLRKSIMLPLRDSDIQI